MSAHRTLLLLVKGSGEMGTDGNVLFCFWWLGVKQKGSREAVYVRSCKKLGQDLECERDEVSVHTGLVLAVEGSAEMRAS